MRSTLIPSLNIIPLHTSNEHLLVLSITIDLILPYLEKKLSLKERVIPTLMVDGVMASLTYLIPFMDGGT